MKRSHGLHEVPCLTPCLRECRGKRYSPIFRHVDAVFRRRDIEERSVPKKCSTCGPHHDQCAQMDAGTKFEYGRLKCRSCGQFYPMIMVQPQEAVTKPCIAPTNGPGFIIESLDYILASIEKEPLSEETPPVKLEPASKLNLVSKRSLAGTEGSCSIGRMRKGLGELTPFPLRE